MLSPFRRRLLVVKRARRPPILPLLLQRHIIADYTAVGSPPPEDSQLLMYRSLRLPGGYEQSTGIRNKSSPPFPGTEFLIHLKLVGGRRLTAEDW